MLSLVRESLRQKLLAVHCLHSKLASLQKPAPVVQRQHEDEQATGDRRNGEEHPKQEVVCLLRQQFPVPEDLIDVLVLFLLASHHRDDPVHFVELRVRAATTSVALITTPPP